MVTFVPAFVSQEVADWEKMAENEFKRIESQTTDSVEKRRLFDEWKSAHADPTRRWPRWPITSTTSARWRAWITWGSAATSTGSRPRRSAWRTCRPSPASSPSWSRRGWSDDDLKKLAGQNLLRAFRAAEATAARLQKERQPSTKTIDQLDRGIAGVP